jgi:tRNA 5-methylaminomethyl-2-thiouridine biosynthesis bifunctional protein
LVFNPDGTPEATNFADIYFNRGGGLAESEAVFVAGCGLPQAWVGRQTYTIAELGFGTGLNALAAWRAWRAHRQPGAILHFVSIEAHPMARADAARALAAFPEMADLANRLLARWPVQAFGPQRLWFEADGFCLTVHVAEASVALARLDGRIDAWFLWTPEIFAQIAALSAPGARLATYSTAGHVRRGLTAAGFAVEKRPGFGAKRERLEGRLRAEAAPNAHPFAPAPQSLIILGAGIAGAWLSAAARRRGLSTLLLDAAPGPASGASGNPAALLMPRLDRADTGQSRMFLAAYLAALDGYASLGADAYAPIGVIETARAGRADALADLLADPPLPDELFCAHSDGALHAKAGLVFPKAAIARLIDGTQTRYGVKIARLAQESHGWTVYGAEGAPIAAAQALVLANGPGLNAFAQTAVLPIEWSRGQIEWGPAAQAAPGPARAGGPYAAPYGDGLLFGATFDKMAAETAVAPDAPSRSENLKSLAALAPDWAARIDPDRLVSRASLRAATPDRAPIAGPAPDANALSPNGEVAHLPGLYLLGGLGARGFLLSPLLAETIVSRLMGETSALDREALAAIDPARFLLRAMRRSRR